MVGESDPLAMAVHDVVAAFLGTVITGRRAPVAS
jgi:hypothetical protein